MTTPLDELRTDLSAEQAALEALVADLKPAQWVTPTPSEGWAVRDQIAHLAYFDEAAALAITDPEGFARELAVALEDVRGYEARYIERGRALRNDIALIGGPYHATRDFGSSRAAAPARRRRASRHQASRSAGASARPRSRYRAS